MSRIVVVRHRPVVVVVVVGHRYDEQSVRASGKRIFQRIG